MTYITGDIPVGAYVPQRWPILASVTQRSTVARVTPISIRKPGMNYPRWVASPTISENPDTDYRNGVDFHLDMGASQFLSKQVTVGLVGYAYQQLTGDSGGRVGDFKSRVFGVGPQVGFIFPLGTSHQGYVNLKGYKEFGAEHRPEGWNAWLTFVIFPAALAAPTSAMRHMVSK